METIESRRTSTRAVLRVPPWAVRAMREQFGPTVTVLGDTDDGRVEVEVGAPRAEMIAERLAGWGALLEVVAPDEVRQQLRRIGAELVERYAS